MDRRRLKRRFGLVLALGGLAIALTYLGTLANRARLTWASYRAEAEREEGKADAEALNASLADKEVESALQQGRKADAAQWGEYARAFRQEEARHRQKSQEWLRRW